MPQSENDIIDSLYKLYEQSMYYEAYEILHDEYLAEDAVHEAFLRLIRNRHKIFDPTSPKVRAYAYKALKSAALDIYRRNKRYKENCRDGSEVADSILEDKNLDFDSINSRLLELTPKYAIVVRCLFIRELSIKETSAVLKISEACVRKRLQRARKQLKQLREARREHNGK